MNQNERLRDREKRYKRKEKTSDTNAYKGNHIWHFASIVYDKRAINAQLYVSKQSTIALNRQPHLPNMHTNQSFSNSFHLIHAAESVGDPQSLVLYTLKHKILYERWARKACLKMKSYAIEIRCYNDRTSGDTIQHHGNCLPCRVAHCSYFILCLRVVLLHLHFTCFHET